MSLYPLVNYRMMVYFKDIKFGEISAEQEKNECPDLLIKGLIDDGGIVNKIIRGNKYLIYGQKGSGKSAIGTRIALEYKDSHEVRPRYCKMNDLDYKLFKQFDTSRESNKSERFSKNWSTILYIAILDMFDRNPEYTALSKSAKDAIKYLKNANVLPSDKISSIITKASKNKLIKIPIGEANMKTEFRYESHEELHEQLRHSVITSKSSALQMLLIDELDEVLSFKSEHYAILSALLRATAQVNETLVDEGINVKIVLFIRTDMLDKLDYPNKQKVVSGYGEELSWYQEGVQPQDTNLIRLLNVRASLSAGTEIHNLFSYFNFPRHCRGKEIRKYILDNTRHLPRDIVQLMHYIQIQCRDKIDEKNLTVAISHYSMDYFYGEIRDNLAGMIGETDRDNMLRLFTYLQSYDTTEGKLRELAETNQLKIDFDKTLPILYDVGAIGNVSIFVDDGKKTKRYHFKYRERYSMYNKNLGIIIHLALQHALKVKGVSSANIVDFE